MDKQKMKHVPLSNIKQMSIKRQNLEKSSDELTANLEELHKVNEEQEHRITNTLTELQHQQKMAEELLNADSLSIQKDDGSVKESGRRKVQREPTVIRQLRHWTTADVIRWLENKKLHKFILLFQRRHVSGTDLADINLPFLEEYDHISVEDRELLLAEVYELLRLECSEENDSSRLKTPVEKEKYLAAVHLTKDKDLYQRSISMPYVILSPQHASSQSSPNSDTLSPTPKLRKRSSEPGIDVRLSNSHQQNFKPVAMETKMEKNVRQPSHSSGTMDDGRKSVIENTNERNSVPENRTLYRTLGGQNVHVYCVQLNKQDNGQFIITVETDDNGHIVIGQVNESEQVSNIQSGDRVLEVNGFSLLSDRHGTDVLQSVIKIMEESDVLQLVILPALSQRDGYFGCGELTSNNNLTEEFKWNQLRRLLVTMKNQDVDPTELMKNVPDNDLHDMKDKVTLQDEIKELQMSITEQQDKIHTLQAELESKKTDVEELEMQRDRALNIGKKSDSKRQGETAYYKITMETLDVQSASKDQVVDLLKEIVKEASKQKFYLDRLISVVVDEVPWILEQVDADFDEMSLGSQSEEFC